MADQPINTATPIRKPEFGVISYPFTPIVLRIIFL